MGATVIPAATLRPTSFAELVKGRAGTMRSLATDVRSTERVTDLSMTPCIDSVDDKLAVFYSEVDENHMVSLPPMLLC